MLEILTMIKVNVEQATKYIHSQFKNLDAKQITQATVRAINRSLQKGRTTARSEVKKVYNIPQKNLEGIKTIPAKASTLTGAVAASTKPIPMDAFSPKFQTQTSSIKISRKGIQVVKRLKSTRKRTQQGVSIEVTRGNRQVVPYAFMIAGAKPRVFARGKYRTGGGSFGFIQRNKRVNKSGNDTPIKPLVSTTIHTAVVNDKVIHSINRDVSPYYADRLYHELTQQVNKMQGNV